MVLEYTIIVIAVVALSSSALLFVLNKNKLLNLNAVLSVTTASIAISVAFPFILGAFLDSPGDSGRSSFKMGVFWAFAAALLIYMMLVFLVAIIISMFISEKRAQEISRNIWKYSPGKLLGIISTRVSSAAALLKAPEISYTEKHVDSEQIIDTMGLENIVEQPLFPAYESELEAAASVEELASVEEPDSVEELEVVEELDSVEEPELVEGPDSGAFVHDIELSDMAACGNDVVEDQVTGVNQEECEITKLSKPDMLLNVDDCINEAFRLKECGDSEGAILHYMYALDKNPDKGLIFWIILDICVLYKSLGQAELARDILESIIAGCGDVMDVVVRAEIERNL